MSQLAALRQPARLGLVSKCLCLSTCCGLGQSALRGKRSRRAWPADGDKSNLGCMTKSLFGRSPSSWPSPPGRRNHLGTFLLFRLMVRPIPSHENFKQPARVSPSPWGEGRDEGGRKNKLFSPERELAQLAALRQPAWLDCKVPRPVHALRIGTIRAPGENDRAGRGQPTVTKAVWDERTTGDDKRKYVLTLALILAFSPGEKEPPWRIFDFSDDGPANPVAGFSKRRRTFLLLLGEKAGMREVVKHLCRDDRAAKSLASAKSGQGHTFTTAGDYAVHFWRRMSLFEASISPCAAAFWSQ